MEKRKFTEDHRKKISQALKGRHQSVNTEFKKGRKPTSVWNKGIPMNDEVKLKLSESLKGRQVWSKGKKFSIEYRKKLSDSHKGKKLSEEQKRKIGLKSKGKTPWNKGKKHSFETKEKIRLAVSGEKSSAWRGGISKLPYSQDWTKTLKRSIRERDNYVCKICGDIQTEEAFSVHHIDYDKHNCSPKNLITLCRSCHAKTNHNRENWIEYFKNLVCN
jgi:hypothetical protein